MAPSTPSDSLPALPPGYRQVSLLRARDPVWVLHALDGGGRDVLLRLDTTPEAREGLAELAVLGAVEHPGVARLVDHGALPGGGRFLAREWVAGEDLETWARDRSPEEVGAVLARLSPALDHLHRQGFVHADLKPANVIVGPEGRPVLVDFGLARTRGTARSGAGVSGTYYYIAPEELLGLELSPAADLFALGAMLHGLVARERRSPREFYARFPESSFLDAAGTEPEQLPEWSRDLIVGLTARDPGRRPRSAVAVGRTLADRLGIEIPAAEVVEPLRWPVALGREVFLAEWRNRIERGEAPRSWVRVPPLEDPRPLWEHLRLYTALRGRRLRGVDLEAEVRPLRDGVALDRWAAHLVAEAPEWIAVLVEGLDPWIERALTALDRAARMERDRSPQGHPVVFYVSAAEVPLTGLEDTPAPAVTAEGVQRFLTRHLPAEEPERLRAFAERLAAAAEGSATLLDRALLDCTRAGWILAEDAGHRLRPGELGDPAVLIQPAPGEGIGELDPAERDLLGALEVCAKRASAQELAALVGEGTDMGRDLLRLREAGWVELTSQGGRTLVRLRRALDPEGVDTERLRSLHRRRAELLEDTGEDPARAALHRFLAEADEGSRRRLALALDQLHGRGRAEAALEITEHLLEGAATLGLDVAREAPELLIERARAWCSIGQTDLALSELETPALTATAALEARAELVRAQVASLRHETEEAFARFERASDLDPAVEVEAEIGRIQLLHSLGRDEEVLERVRELAPEELEAAGRLEGRRRIFLRSMEAMSAMRLGRVEDARTATEGLIAELADSEDAAARAALHINLAIIERVAGSLERARTAFEESIRLYDHAGIISGLAHARATLGGLLRDLGELIDAEPLLVSAMETRERLNDSEGSGTARGMLGLLYFERGHARSAIETLESTAEAMGGAQRRRYAPLLLAKAIEMRNRIGDTSSNDRLPADDEAIDPRILLSRARIAWMQGERETALELARRCESLSHSLKQERLAREAHALAARLEGVPAELPPLPASERETLVALDERVFDLLHSDVFDEREAEELARTLGRRGRDDRAARLWMAVAARTPDRERARQALQRAQEHWSLCAAGLTEAEESALRNTLLGEPDPWPGDFTARVDAEETDEEFEMEIIRLLEINKQLVQQQDLDSLLGVIVENALEVTGAERGFLVLEEHGEIRFDTALDSCRGDIAQPEFEVSGSVVREALDRMEPLRVSNAVDDPELAHQNSVVSLELRSILCVPFSISDDLRGAIYVDHRLRKAAFDERAEKLCSLLANQAAVVIQQMKRMEEIRNLNRVLERRVVERETDLQNARRALREVGAPEPGRLIGKSKAIMEVRELLEKAAASDLSVVIVGESGTGKEVAARCLHEMSPRSRSAFVSENCAALPPSLIESELFGYRRGAFTGADRDRAGLFEQAHGGTLFLDEVGELPLDLQAKFLRVLETGEVRRLGDEEARPVDFRLVVATNRDLEEEVRERRFRQDLFYRLEGLRVRMPALAERTEDIALLVDHFLRMEEAKTGVRRRITKRVLSALARRPWPGNVRELKNEISRLCVLCEGDIEDPSLVSTPATLRSSGADKTVVPLAELERQAIQNALELTGGDKRRAAELLGISRAKIYQRLKEWRDEETKSSGPAKA